MTDYKIDPHLQQALLTGGITRVTLDLERKTVTIWYKDRDLANELDRQVDHYNAMQEGACLKKADYAFDVKLLIALQGLFVTSNDTAESNNKATFRFDLYRDIKIENLR